MADAASEPWGALLPEGGRVTLFALRGDDLETRDLARAADAESVAGIDPARLVTLDNSARAAPPAEILPKGLRSLGALQQAGPAALLTAEARVLIAGALTAAPDWDGILLIPEPEVTHWVHVSAREVVSFQGAATGRLARAFGAKAGEADTGALDDTMSRPERLAVHLNAAALTGDHSALWGHLLGAELAATRAYWLGQGVRIIGDAEPYAAALAAQGVMAEAVPRAGAWRAGLRALGAAAGFTG
ncbi:2-dehydro-3-deoxygalactonokinase [Roseovarius aquimarinus]|uniref:2-dehydro-3-deoxygalactonokinase n=1 Tax=Roseovarius aquimarinus TaxID=1229156 RepID=A0ABW7I8C6_9RHOB